MIVTVFMNSDLSTLSTNALFGCGVVSGFLLALTLSVQRWLWWLVGAILYWLSVDILYQWLSGWLPLTDWECYVVALGLCWLPFAAWISYRILRYGSVSHIYTAEAKTAATDIECEDIQPTDPISINTNAKSNSQNCAEHSPVYDSDFKTRFR